MCPQYDYHQREHNTSWQLVHIEVLLEEAEKYHNSSLIFYAALESRNMLEQTEFELILMSTNQEEWEDVVSMAKGKSGLSKGNNKYKALKYKYQSFSEALTKVILDFSLKIYDYKTSADLQSQLADYIHIYTRTPDEIKFDSDYIQAGIVVIKEALSFVKSFYVKKDDGYIFGIVNFNTLSKPMKDEFERWKNDVSEDVDSLYLRIKKINDEQSGGAKAVLVK